MASTNKTTNYDLSQYVGSDKPSYLNDYNQDMNKIDLGIHAAKSEADTNATAIGDLSDLTTTAKTNLVSAINEVDSNADTANATAVQADGKATTNATAIGTLANLETTAKSNLVNAINEVEGNVEKFNLTSFTTYAASDMTTTGDVSISGGVLYVATNSNGSIFKVYTDGLLVSFNGTNDSTISINTNIRPSDNIFITGAGTIFDEDSSRIPFWVRGASFSVDTNGVLTINLKKDFTTGEYQLYIYNSCLYFAKDFGDTPTPTP